MIKKTQIQTTLIQTNTIGENAQNFKDRKQLKITKNERSAEKEKGFEVYLCRASAEKHQASSCSSDGRWKRETRSARLRRGIQRERDSGADSRGRSRFGYRRRGWKPKLGKAGSRKETAKRSGCLARKPCREGREKAPPSRSCTFPSRRRYPPLPAAAARAEPPPAAPWKSQRRASFQICSISLSGSLLGKQVGL